MYGKDHFTRLGLINFAKFAEALGVEARTIQNDTDVDEAIKWAINAS